HAQEFENSVSDFVTQLQNTHAGSVEVPPGVAAGFAELGRVLIQVKAQHDARAIMLQTDPAIQAIFTTMASAIGDNQRSSLRGTVFSNWTTLMTGPQRNFVTVGSDTERKRQAILGYREMLDRRDS